jgi:hypothetical protein
MSITPIEGNGDRTGEEASEPGQTGVRARVRALGRRLLNGLRSVLSSTGNTPQAQSRAPAEDDRTETDLVVGSQHSASGVPATRQRVNGATDRPPTPGEQSNVDTQRQGDRFRVYDPDDPDAYISSDSWVRVER